MASFDHCSPEIIAKFSDAQLTEIETLTRETLGLGVKKLNEVERGLADALEILLRIRREQHKRLKG